MHSNQSVRTFVGLAAVVVAKIRRFLRGRQPTLNIFSNFLSWASPELEPALRPGQGPEFPARRPARNGQQQAGLVLPGERLRCPLPSCQSPDSSPLIALRVNRQKHGADLFINAIIAILDRRQRDHIDQSFLHLCICQRSPPAKNCDLLVKGLRCAMLANDLIATRYPGRCGGSSNNNDRNRDRPAANHLARPIPRLYRRGNAVRQLPGRLRRDPAVFKHHNTYCSYADTIMPQFFFAVGFAFRLTYSAKADRRAGRRLPPLPFSSAALALIVLGFVVYHLDGNVERWSDLRTAWHFRLPRPSLQTRALSDLGADRARVDLGSAGDRCRPIDPCRLLDRLGRTASLAFLAILSGLGLEDPGDRRRLAGNLDAGRSRHWSAHSPTTWS